MTIFFWNSNSLKTSENLNFLLISIKWNNLVHLYQFTRRTFFLVWTLSPLRQSPRTSCFFISCKRFVICFAFAWLESQKIFLFLRRSQTGKILKINQGKVHLAKEREKRFSFYLFQSRATFILISSALPPYRYKSHGCKLSAWSPPTKVKKKFDEKLIQFIFYKFNQSFRGNPELMEKSFEDNRFFRHNFIAKCFYCHRHRFPPSPVPLKQG